MSKLNYKLLENGVEFNVLESRTSGCRDVVRTSVVEWNHVNRLDAFPAREPSGFFMTELFWLEPARTWVAFVLTSHWENSYGNDDNYLGPFRFLYPPPIAAERSNAKGGHGLVRVQLRVFTPAMQYVTSSLQSVFISYGGPDTLFAETLNDVLRLAGVATFFFPTDAPPGAKLHHVMRDGVNHYDRVILICSRTSLSRTGVLNELEETLQREAREGGRAILIPITIDDYVFADWAPSRPGVAQAVRDRVVADFRAAEYGTPRFERAIAHLIQALALRSDLPPNPSINPDAAR